MQGEVSRAVESVTAFPLKRWKMKGLRLRRGLDKKARAVSKFIDAKAESTSRSQSSEISGSVDEEESEEDSESSAG